MTYISSVWSSFGHRFMSGAEYDDDGQGDESCLTYGATYRLVLKENAPEGSAGTLSQGAYIAADGSIPMECTGDTGMVHAYPGERCCMDSDCDRSAPCAHEDHNCNCLVCA